MGPMTAALWVQHDGEGSHSVLGFSREGHRSSEHRAPCGTAGGTILEPIRGTRELRDLGDSKRFARSYSLVTTYEFKQKEY